MSTLDTNHTTDGVPQLVRPRDAARLLGVSPATLWRLARLPEFPVPYRLGLQAVAWSAPELRAWLETRRARPSEIA